MEKGTVFLLCDQNGLTQADMGAKIRLTLLILDVQHNYDQNQGNIPTVIMYNVYIHLHS